LRQWSLQQGRFLPETDPERATPVCVLGAEVKRELFGNENALGKTLSIGDRRFRIMGVLSTEGRTIGLDVEKLVIIPVASAQSLFNTPTLFRILVEAKSRDAIPAASDFIRKTITRRHQDEEDITVITQDAVLATFDRIFQALTLTLAGIAAISLAVAGILIMNIMLVAVSQRTAEIGLLKALGAPPGQITILFITEAFLLSCGGAVLGILIGNAGIWALSQFHPALQSPAPWWAEIAAVLTAVSSGLVFGALPAKRASRLNPVTALSKK
jgi:putative ABC transport system permease protein